MMLRIVDCLPTAVRAGTAPVTLPFTTHVRRRQCMTCATRTSPMSVM